MRRPPADRAATLEHLFATIARNHSRILRTNSMCLTLAIRVCAHLRRYRMHRDWQHRGATRTRTSTLIRKKPRTAIRITSAASRDHASPAFLESASCLRVSWASRTVNCCAMFSRNATPPVCIRAPAAQREENESTRGERFAHEERCETRSDRRDACVFSFEPRAIAAFARETAERESRDTVARDCVSHRMRTSRESIGHALYADTATAHDAHDSHDSRKHKTACTHRNSNYSLRLSLANSELRNRRLSRVHSRSSATSPSSSSPPSIPIPISSTLTDSIPRTPPISRSIPIAAVSANSISPPMDPRDAAEIFSSAVFGLPDFRAACETLRNCAEVDLVIRGLDAQFTRDIANTGANSMRDFLRSRFAKLPETLRALYEYAIVGYRDAAPALSISSSGHREEVALGCLHVRSCCAALSIVELFRSEFAARPEHEKPQILVVPHGLGWPTETPTPPDSGTASSSTPRPPIAPPRVFGAESAAPPLSFTSAKSIAEASAAAAALAALNAAMREEEYRAGSVLASAVSEYSVSLVRRGLLEFGVRADTDSVTLVRVRAAAAAEHCPLVRVRAAAAAEHCPLVRVRATAAADHHPLRRSISTDRCPHFLRTAAPRVYRPRHEFEVEGDARPNVARLPRCDQTARNAPRCLARALRTRYSSSPRRNPRSRTVASARSSSTKSAPQRARRLHS